jgi:N-acetyl-gamma-glutamyl-phosphate reductase
MALPKWTRSRPKRSPHARFVANPGCYPTGAIGLIRPLRAAGILPDGYPVTVNAVSGYTGGGKQMIAQMENPDHPDAITAPHFLYGLPLTHKHVPEMTVHGLLDRAPIFSPSVGKFAQGMIVQVPLHLDDLAGHDDGEHPRRARRPLCRTGHRQVVPLAESKALPRVNAVELEGKDTMKLFVFGTPGDRR